ncbi:hypothetical protein BCR44DRAFT_38286, partial [Catenaria anguillulae PL171]
MRLASSTVEVPVRVAGHDIDALVDSGSQVGLVSQALCKSAGWDMRPMPDGMKSVRVANGSLADLLGAVVLPVSVLGFSKYAMFFVMEGLSRGMILDLNTMQDLGITVRAGLKGISVETEAEKAFFDDDSRFAGVGVNSAAVDGSLPGQLKEDESVHEGRLDRSTTRLCLPALVAPTSTRPRQSPC